MNAKKIHIFRPLNRRLNQVLQLLGYGWTEQEIAQRLGIGVGTARTYSGVAFQYPVARTCAV